MNLLCRVPRTSNRFVILFAVLISTLPAQSQFRDALDRRVAKDMIKTFAASCALKVSAEFDTVDSLKMEIADARRTKIPEILKCFDTYFSQIQGIVFVYEKTCSEVTSTLVQNISDNRLAWQIQSIAKYEQGMRPFHSSLNDCLLSVPNRKGRRFVVPLVSAGFSVSELKTQLETIEVKDPYVHAAVPFR